MQFKCLVIGTAGSSRSHNFALYHNENENL